MPEIIMANGSNLMIQFLKNAAMISMMGWNWMIAFCYFMKKLLKKSPKINNISKKINDSEFKILAIFPICIYFF